MDAEFRRIISSLETRIASLEILLKREISRIDKRMAGAEDGFSYYVDLHGAEFREVSKLARLAFYKTHPEVLTTLIECDKIVGTGSDDGSDPQP